MRGTSGLMIMFCFLMWVLVIQICSFVKILAIHLKSVYKLYMKNKRNPGYLFNLPFLESGCSSMYQFLKGLAAGAVTLKSSREGTKQCT